MKQQKAWREDSRNANTFRLRVVTGQYPAQLLITLETGMAATASFGIEKMARLESSALVAIAILLISCVA